MPSPRFIASSKQNLCERARYGPGFPGDRRSIIRAILHHQGRRNRHGTGDRAQHRRRPRRHSGRENCEGGGALFTVSLPAATEAKSQVAEQRHLPTLSEADSKKRERSGGVSREMGLRSNMRRGERSAKLVPVRSFSPNKGGMPPEQKIDPPQALARSTSNGCWTGACDGAAVASSMTIPPCSRRWIVFIKRMAFHVEFSSPTSLSFYGIGQSPCRGSDPRCLDAGHEWVGSAGGSPEKFAGDAHHLHQRAG